MMLLAIDVGNTNIKLGLFSGGRLINSWRLATDRSKTGDEYGVARRYRRCDNVLGGSGHKFHS